MEYVRPDGGHMQLRHKVEGCDFCFVFEYKVIRNNSSNNNNNDNNNNNNN